MTEYQLHLPNQSIVGILCLQINHRNYAETNAQSLVKPAKVVILQYCWNAIYDALTMPVISGESKIMMVRYEFVHNTNLQKALKDTIR